MGFLSAWLYLLQDEHGSVFFSLLTFCEEPKESERKRKRVGIFFSAGGSILSSMSSWLFHGRPQVEPEFPGAKFKFPPISPASLNS